MTFLDNMKNNNLDDFESNNKSKKKRLIYLGITIGALILIAISVVLIIIFTKKDQDESDKGADEEIIYGNITSIYNLESGEINILSDEFEGDDKDMNIYIGDKKINFTKIYNFSLDEPKTVRFEIITKELSMINMFKNISNLTNITISSDNNGKIISMESAFEQCIQLENFTFEKGWDTSELISTKKFFSNCTNLQEFDLDNINFTNVKDMSYMFQNTKLVKFNANNSDLSSVETMAFMFENCSHLNEIVLPKSEYNNLKDISYMFSGCSSLFHLDISNLNTSKVENMKGLFKNCLDLNNITFGSFDTSQVTDMSHMF